jgi:hypothetical protein
MVQRHGTIHPLCSRARVVECFDYMPKKRMKIVVVRTEVARETAQNRKSANDSYDRVEGMAHAIGV